MTFTIKLERADEAGGGSRPLSRGNPRTAHFLLQAHGMSTPDPVSAASTISAATAARMATRIVTIVQRRILSAMGKHEYPPRRIFRSRATRTATSARTLGGGRGSNHERHVPGQAPGRLPIRRRSAAPSPTGGPATRFRWAETGRSAWSRFETTMRTKRPCSSWKTCPPRFKRLVRMQRPGSVILGRRRVPSPYERGGFGCGRESWPWWWPAVHFSRSQPPHCRLRSYIR
jgi:hypothetical protein